MIHYSKILKILYEILPTGILVTDLSFKEVYFNSAYLNIMNENSSKDIKKNKNHLEFINALKIHHNKGMGTVRIMDEKTDDLILFDIFINKLKKKYQFPELLTISLIPIKNREKLYKTSTSDSLIFDNIRIFILNNIVKFKNEIIPFSATEFSLFLYLAKNEDKLLSKHILLKEVWGRINQETRSVDIYVSRIRKKLNSVGCKKQYIKTLHGQGYIFQV